MNYREMLEININSLLKKDTEDLQKNINSFKIKIENLKKRNSDLDFSNIEEDVKNGNPYAIALLRKEPQKQNVSEKTFFEYVNLKRLPQSGEKAIRFGASKAADFKIGNYYGTQKFIEERGGSQDNQINDAVLFAKECNANGHKAIICIDGKYGEERINKLLKSSDDCIITTADKLKEDIKNGRY